MDERKAREWWLEICEEFGMSMDGSYYDAALEMARRATLAERERAAKVCERERMVRGGEVFAAEIRRG